MCPYFGATINIKLVLVPPLLKAFHYDYIGTYKCGGDARMVSMWWRQGENTSGFFQC